MLEKEVSAFFQFLNPNHQKETPNLFVLYDVSCLISVFAIPYVRNLNNGRDVHVKKYHRIVNLPIKLVVTPMIKTTCAQKLCVCQEVNDVGISDVMMKDLLAQDIFCLRDGTDTKITPLMLSDFEGVDGKHEDAFHISTANAYGIPIVTGERKKLPIWQKHCANRVIQQVEFWKFIANCNDRFGLTPPRENVQKLFLKTFPPN